MKFNILTTKKDNPKVSYYYKYDFISPEIIYSQLKEELKSYFQTGVVDDLLFPTYTEELLRNLGKSSYKIEENIFRLGDFEAKLPDNFYAIREAWLVTSTEQSYRMPTGCYEQATVRITPDFDRCTEQQFCAPKEIKVTYKTTGTLIQSFQCLHLLKPGNVNARNFCVPGSPTLNSNSMETFDIRNNKLITNFPEGTLYLVYYVKEYDENNYQMIPDNQRIIDYIKAYLKYKCFETIYNNVSDETVNQIERKMLMYKQEMLEKKVIAETEIKMQTVEQQIRATKTARRRLNKYQIS